MSKSNTNSAPADGQVHGTKYGAQQSMGKPLGMVYVPTGAFKLSTGDVDADFTNVVREREVTVKGFWMDATEITNSQYHQFTDWVRDSIAALELGFFKVNKGGDTAIDWERARKINYSDAVTIERLSRLYLPQDKLLYNKPEMDVSKFVYRIEGYDYEAAARNSNMPRNQFLYKYDVAIYPDTLVWVRDFYYSYNVPQSQRYYSHPSYAKYPVVGVSWKQAVAFCHWRTHYLNTYLEKKKIAKEGMFRLPTEAEWEYAARGGLKNNIYPWGNELKNAKNCLMANFKPGNGNYAEDGAIYTATVNSYWPNGYGLYNMAGNVAEWTMTYYYEGQTDFEHDMNPDVHWSALDSDPVRMKRKVVRGGSWKDAAHYLQNDTRTYDYQDSAHSYIGFRCVIDLTPAVVDNKTGKK
ncbi:MAG: SUMF1/EgtB/PvdO family nonheme iron enzyme [Chitinophagaceae bacterium]|nr:SUMF1/EgtB/PvdO family nonheme iron enzyme [Chitinophagaceae bacterium]